MEAANTARPLPYFDYVPTHRGEPSHRQEQVPSPRYTDRKREISRSNRSGRPYTEQQGRCAAARPSGHLTQGATTKSTTASTPYATHSRRTTWLEEQEGHPMLRRPSPMIAPLKPQNARKYCEFHEQSGHTTTKCRELKKSLHELASKGQIDRFLKRRPRFLR
ncbi:hypothetical protein Cgig2_030109 [Carnegiea gigantea]|uniref:Reverse transcriptase domain-containing protein n=1 Tax=Carnegiea gigantea TaxID=171969 RepID=A0A9Q1Q673_9CARY|nr:hypothetical protein Cgig2_030109 [Carnegiea gigantea]